jgi:hypothetical protein
MAKRRRNTYGDFRRPTISEGSDSGMTNDCERREDDHESRTTEASSTNLSGSHNFEQSGNLEHQSHSNISAAVSPRTTMEDTHVPHLVTHNLLDRDEDEPLTATRIMMDLEHGVSKANNDDASNVTSHLFGGAEETIYNTQDQSLNPNSNLQIQDNAFNTPESSCPEMDRSLLSVYATPNYSHLHTPLHTPQLTSTPMSAALPATAVSTPQLNTPDPQDHMRNYGLGLHIPEPTCMGLSMDNLPYPLQQSMLQHSQALHGLASPPRSMTHPMVTGAPNSATLTSMQFAKPHHQQMHHNAGHQRHLSMPQMDSYPNIDMPMATSSSRFSQHDMLMHGGGSVPINELQDPESGHHLSALHHGGVHAGFSWSS